MSAADHSDAAILRFLSATALVTDLDPLSREKLAERMEKMFVPAGTAIIRQGDPGDALYVVINGRLRVSVRRDGHDLVLAELGRGDIIGEMALMTDDRRTATVTTIRDAQLLRLSKRDFQVLIKRRPGVLLGISRLVIKRLQASMHGQPEASLPRTVTIAPIGSGFDAVEFSKNLARSLGEHGSVIRVDRETASAQRRFNDSIITVGERIVLDARRFKLKAATESAGEHTAAEEEASEDTAADGEMTQWLHRMESGHDFIVYLCDAELSPWTERCLRQSDRILLVASAKDNPVPGPIERAMDAVDDAQSDSRGYLNRELVLLNDPTQEDRPRGTDRWLNYRKGLRHHHIRGANYKDLARLCRALLGREMGLVLSGGGARGCAHVGVLRALEECEIPVDAIGGTSVGSIMGAGPAMGWDWKQLLEGVKRTLVDPGPPVDYTVPIAALTKGEKATVQIQKTFGGYDIEDLWLPYFAVSSNLTRGSVNVHRKGSLWRAIRSSVALPGILPPMRSGDGDVLVDGAIMNNLPVDVMREVIPGGTIFAVNVRPDVYMGAGELPEDGILSGWSLLGRWINGFGTKTDIPGIGQLLLRTSETGNVLSTKEHEEGAALTFNPPVAGVGLMEFTALERLAEVGYRHAMEQLEGWLSRVK